MDIEIPALTEGIEKGEFKSWKLNERWIYTNVNNDISLVRSNVIGLGPLLYTVS